MFHNIPPFIKPFSPLIVSHTKDQEQSLSKINVKITVVHPYYPKQAAQS